MEYRPLVEGRFIKRINRFIAEVEVDGQVEKVHVKNTGRCKELFTVGVKVYLEPSDNPDRKTRFSLISLYKGDLLINIDSQVPNQVVYEALLAGDIKEIQDVTYAKREVKHGNSRFDIYYETSTAKGFIEVKGVTLEVDGLAMFPDAPTVRGARHIAELTEGLDEGYRNYVFFLVQIGGIKDFRPHHERDMNLADTLYSGKDAGLGILVYDSVVTEKGIVIGKKGQLLEKGY